MVILALLGLINSYSTKSQKKRHLPRARQDTSEATSPNVYQAYANRHLLSARNNTLEAPQNRNSLAVAVFTRSPNNFASEIFDGERKNEASSLLDHFNKFRKVRAWYGENVDNTLNNPSDRLANNNLRDQFRNFLLTYHFQLVYEVLDVKYAFIFISFFIILIQFIILIPIIIIIILIIMNANIINILYQSYF